MTHQGTRALATERLLLRPMTARDAAALWGPDGKAPDYGDPQVYQWAIVRRDRELLLGQISAGGLSGWTQSAELQYALLPAHWNQGYATEAVKAVIRYLLQDVGLHRVTACHDTANPASGRVLQKAGMLQEGLLRQSAPHGGDSWGDVALYAAIRGQRPIKTER